MELLTRLASVLCNDNEEEDISLPETMITDVEHSLEKKEICEESAFDRIRRSLRVTKNSNDDHSRSPSPLKVQGVFLKENEHSIVTDRRVRHVSESHRESILNCRGSMRSPRQLLLVQETSEFKRSNSEKFAPIKNMVPSFIFTPPSDCSHQLKKNVPGGVICNMDNTARNEWPINADVVKLCDMLDHIQISRQSNSAPQEEK